MTRLESTPEVASDDALPLGEPMFVDDIRDALVIRERGLLLVTDWAGNIPPGNRRGLGLYHADARHLSTYHLILNGSPPLVLLSTSEQGYAMEQVLTNRAYTMGDLRAVERGSIEIRRLRTVTGSLEETISIRNFNPFSVEVSLLFELGADFADIFDVRGYRRQRWGQTHEPVLSPTVVAYSYTGIDSVLRTTALRFDRRPDFLDASSALYRLTLPARGHDELTMQMLVDQVEPTSSDAERVRESYAGWHAATTAIETDNALVNRVIDRSLSDMRMLWEETPDGGGFPVAGVPWFDTLFGRDACIVGMQMLAFNHAVAASVLRCLAQEQATRVDPSHDEEPGKILHERRRSELSRAGELPYRRYYGSVDATPLFVLLAAEYLDWTGDEALIRELLPEIKAACSWMLDYGGIRRDGFLSYGRHAAGGLVNQGWKDSADAILHADGSPVRPPIALIEVQAYAAAALRHAAMTLEHMEDPDLASGYTVEAERLTARIDSLMWCEETQAYALGLDDAGRQIQSLTSNAGHVLWAGVAAPERATAVAGALGRPAMFSGWGIRTLSSAHPRFNPIGYHIGSVWPHDNSMIAMGLKRYGLEDGCARVARALFDVAAASPYFRLPELFGGHDRSEYSAPVPYPVACRPQAWAAGSFLLVVQALLGLCPDALHRRLRIVNPTLPEWLSTVHVRRLKVGGGEVSLTYRRQGHATDVKVDSVSGDLKVLVTSQWPT
jgi:glycogen debranching enzyme